MSLCKRARLLCALLLAACGASCAPQAAPMADNPLQLAAAEKAIFANACTPFWVSGHDAIWCGVTPVHAQAGGTGFAMQALYRRYSSGEARFTLLLAQGTSLGQCLRAGKTVQCRPSAIPRAEELLPLAFAALENLLDSAPRPGDAFSLQAWEGGGLAVLRKRQQGPGDLTAVSSLAGQPRKVYFRQPGLFWEIVFEAGEGPVDRYTFRAEGEDFAPGWVLHLQILKDAR